MSIHHNLEQIKAVALEYAKEHNCNYNVIIHNPNEKGEFDLSVGSTYEFVLDSYFETPRSNVIRLDTTDNLLKQSAIVGIMDSMDEKKLTPEQETEKIISHFTQVPEGYDRLREDMAKMEIEMNSNNEAGKLKKGLSVVQAQADGVTYKQGSSGLERVANTNRNDKCNCGSGKKFKKCCGK